MKDTKILATENTEGIEISKNISHELTRRKDKRMFQHQFFGAGRRGEKEYLARCVELLLDQTETSCQEKMKSFV